MAYSPTMVANNVLSRAFAERRDVSPMKLQKILYFVASEYQKATKQPLLEEQFSTWAYGPVLYSVFNEFRSFSKDYINRYARDAQGKTFIIDENADIELRAALDRVWARTKQKTAVELSRITHLEDSAWDRAFQKDMPLLDLDDILEDTSYRVPLGLEVAVSE